MRPIVREEDQNIARAASIRSPGVRRRRLEPRQDWILWPRSGRPGIQVRHLVCAGISAIGAPQFGAVDSVVRAEKDKVIVTNEVRRRRWFGAGIDILHPVGALGRSVSAEQLPVVSRRSIMVINDGIICPEISDIAQVGKLNRDRPLRSRMQIEDSAGAGCGSIALP